jgi:hypothetical protein
MDLFPLRLHPRQIISTGNSLALAASWNLLVNSFSVLCLLRRYFIYVLILSDFLRVLSSLYHICLAQQKAPSVLLLRSPILDCHASIWYCWRVDRIDGSVFNCRCLAMTAYDHKSYKTVRIGICPSHHVSNTHNSLLLAWTEYWTVITSPPVQEFPDCILNTGLHIPIDIVHKF